MFLEHYKILLHNAQPDIPKKDNKHSQFISCHCFQLAERARKFRGGEQDRDPSQYRACQQLIEQSPQQKRRQVQEDCQLHIHRHFLSFAMKGEGKIPFFVREISVLEHFRAGNFRQQTCHVEVCRLLGFSMSIDTLVVPFSPSFLASQGRFFSSFIEGS